MRIFFCKARSFKMTVAVWLAVTVFVVLFFINRRGLEGRSGMRSWISQDLFPIPILQGDKPAKTGCIQPVLKVDDPIMMKFYKKMVPISCQKHHEDLVYVDNGTLRFSKSLSSDTKCHMYPLIRGPGDYKISFGPPVENVQDNTSLISDFFKLQCKNGSKIIYENIHLGVHSNATLKNRVRRTRLPANGLQLSVVMLGFDSMSRMSWLRRLPKTRDYFVNELGAIELEGYNIMGDGTPAALFPILTGKHENELPEARRSIKGAKSVDDFPWLWKEFQKNGYITSWADSEINIAPFNYRLLGFQHSPTDFFMRPFYLAATPTLKKYTKGCHGSQRLHQIWFNFVKDIFTMYKNDPKFLFQFYATLSHDNNNPITMGDDDLYQLIHTLENGGYLENTLLVLFADHGARYSYVRATLSGKLEERMPYFALRFPKWFHTKHPDLIQNLKTNAKRLTTPMDIHETLKDILRFDGSGIGNLANRGISLFKEIPKERTCAHADVAPHWCSCMSWENMPINDEGVRQAIQAAIDFINDLTQEYRNICSLLNIKNVTNAYKSAISDSVLRFKETTGDRGLEPVLSAKTKEEKHMYQLTFFITPGEGEFEVTIEHDLKKAKFNLNPKAISRINKYGDAPKCVLDKNREIRQYCYCKSQ